MAWTYLPWRRLIAQCDRSFSSHPHRKPPTHPPPRNQVGHFYTNPSYLTNHSRHHYVCAFVYVTFNLIHFFPTGSVKQAHSQRWSIRQAQNEVGEKMERHTRTASLFLLPNTRSAHHVVSIPIWTKHTVATLNEIKVKWDTALNRNCSIIIEQKLFCLRHRTVQNPLSSGQIRSN